MFPVARGAPLRAPRPENDAGAGHADGPPDEIPAVELSTLNDPQPNERRGDIHAAVGREGTARELGIDPSQADGEKHQADRPRECQEGRASLTQPSPEGKAASDLEERRQAKKDKAHGARQAAKNFRVPGGPVISSIVTSSSDSTSRRTRMKGQQRRSTSSMAPRRSRRLGADAMRHEGAAISNNFR